MIAYVVIGACAAVIAASLGLRYVIRHRTLPNEGQPRSRQEIASALEARRNASDSRHNTQSQPGVINGGGFGF